MRQPTFSLVLLLPLAMSIASCHGFVEFLSPTTSRRPTSAFATKHKHGDNDMVEMRADIERMKAEAAMRLEALSEKLIVASQLQQDDHIQTELPELQKEDGNIHDKKNPPILASLTAPSTSSTARPDRINLDDAKTMESLLEVADTFERDMYILNQKKEFKAKSAAAVSTSQETNAPRHPLKLLDDTRWRLMLNVYRVDGTWMPKTWGASGDRLRLKLEVEFTTDELYEREDYFNGLSDGAKVLRVVHNEAAMAPSMTEGGKTVRVLNGGWRVCPMEGPLGTAILRWYFDLEEQASHLGSDIYVPAGRVYGTCGYFPMLHRSNVDGRGTSKREMYQQEIRQMEVKYVSLMNEMDQDTSLISLDKIQRFREMRDIKLEAKKIKKTIDEELIREPPKDSLRLSRDQSVGLTHEGGICCKKQNGLAQEYHILGKFEIASIENREHSDIRDILRP